MQWRLKLPALSLAIATASCGGGGSASLPPANQPGQPTGSSTAKVRLTIPAAPTSSSAARPHFVSPGANGATIAAGPHGGALTTTTYDISAGSVLCGTLVGGSRTCTLAVVVPFGNDDFTVTLYDTAPSGGSISGTAHVLGTGTVTQSITIGVPATVSLFVSGKINSVGLTSQPFVSFAANGVAQTASIILNPTDFTNAPITAGSNDPYANPISVSLSETGGSGHTVLTINGTPSGTSATLTMSSQTLGIRYDGLGATGYSATVALSATGVTAQSVHAVPLYVTSTSPFFANGVLTFTGTGQTATLNISEAAGSNAYTATLTNTAACTSGASVGTVTGSGASGSVTITSQAAVTSANACVIAVSDGTIANNVSYTNTTTGGGITIGGISEYPTPVAVPNEIATGTDGNLYVASTTGSTIWGYDTSGNEANWSASLPNSPLQLAAGVDGNIWFVDYTGNVYTYSPTTEAVNTFTPTGAGRTFSGVAAGPDGNMWAFDAASSQVVEVTPHGSTGTAYSLSLAAVNMTTSGGAAWVVTQGPNALLYQIVPGSNPLSFSVPGGASNTPVAIAADAAGNLWIADHGLNQIDEYVPGTGWSTYAIGGSSSMNGLAIGSDKNIWFTNSANNTVGRFDVTTHAITTYAIPTALAFPGPVTAGADGRIWFTENNVTQIGAITP